MDNVPTQVLTRRGYFRVVSNGDVAAPVLVLSNSLGTTLEMWDAQVAAFVKDWRVVRYDTRGHGRSPVTPGPYSVADLGRDVLGILESLEVERAAFCGISMGGHTGLWLGIHAPDRLNALVVCNSAACIGTQQGWQERAAMIRAGGDSAMRDLADSAPSRWFTEDFISNEPGTVRRTQNAMAALSPEGYAACCEALAESDLRADLGLITAPTLLVAGEFDPVTTVADAQAMQAGIANSQLAVLPASHLSNFEAPQAFVQTVRGFLAN